MVIIVYLLLLYFNKLEVCKPCGKFQFQGIPLASVFCCVVQFVWLGNNASEVITRTKNIVNIANTVTVVEFLTIYLTLCLLYCMTNDYHF